MYRSNTLGEKPHLFNVLNLPKKKLRINDLINVLALQTPNEPLDHLDSICQKWTFENNNPAEHIVYKNNIQESIIKVIKDKPAQNKALVNLYIVISHS